MRADDVRELAACGQTPLGGLIYAMEGSTEAWTALYDDTVGAMFGVVQGQGLGAPSRLWFLTGHLFGEKRVAFYRLVKHVVPRLLERYGQLRNLIDGRYSGALVLAMALGARFESPVLIGGVPFVPFVLGRP